MQIRCWGARGSIPASGQDYIKYGGNTSCIEVRTQEQVIIFDAGSGIINLNSDEYSNIKHYHLFFSHYHWDHLIGLPFFKPIYQPDIQIEIYGPKLNNQTPQEIITIFFSPPYGPIQLEEVHAQLNFHTITEPSIQIGDISLRTMPLNHPVGGLAYRIEADNKVCVIFMDQEIGFKHKNGMDYGLYQSFAKKADLLIHDATYIQEEYQSKQSWGHSTHEQALEFAIDAQVKKLYFSHHYQERTDVELSNIEQKLKHNLSQDNIEINMLSEGTIIQL